MWFGWPDWPIRFTVLVVCCDEVTQASFFPHGHDTYDRTGMRRVGNVAAVDLPDAR